MPVLQISERIRDLLIATLLALALFVLFAFSLSRPLADSAYTLLISENLVLNRTLNLDRYFNFQGKQNPKVGLPDAREDYRLRVVENHVYYKYPPGSPVLSIPFAMAMKWMGLSCIKEDGTYSHIREQRQQHVISAVLMAAFGFILYLTGRLLVSVGWSVVVTLGVTLGSTAWSSMALALWSDCWGILLCALGIHLLARNQIAGKPLRPVLLSTLLAWSFFVRPTNAVNAVAITVVVILANWRIGLLMIGIGLAWFAGFIWFSFDTYGTPLPDYFQGQEVGTQRSIFGLPGLLFSINRGLFVFSPLFIAILWAIWARRRFMPYRALNCCALAAITVHYAIVVFHKGWGGGYSYGPRLLTGVIPWFALLAFLAIRAEFLGRAFELNERRPVFRYAMTILMCLVGVSIHARGALVRETALWNSTPKSFIMDKGRAWDLTDPQILAGLSSRPTARFMQQVPLHTPVFPGTEGGTPYCWLGWSGPEADGFRWSDGNRASLAFELPEPNATTATLELRAFVVPPVIPHQDVKFAFNGNPVQSVVLTSNKETTITLSVSDLGRSGINVLRIELPDAVSPLALGADDSRVLGVAIRSLRLD
ncbi:MAG: hypothetical protein K1X53_07100 [Candidatus Sumerlaeaceae bacterium]|nr:hypothetical protein [Candidatus Sumerlaeaceae bacterium]